MLKRKNISDVVVVLKGKGNKVAIASWITEDYKMRNHGVKKLNMSGTPAILTTVAQIIDGFVSQKSNAQIGFVIPDDAASKIFQIQKYLNHAGLTAAKRSYRTKNQSWMDENWITAMDTLAESLDVARNSEIVVAVTKESELNYWELTGKTDQLNEGDTITLTAEPVPVGNQWFSATEDRNIFCVNPFVTGDFTVHVKKIINPKTNKVTRSVYRIERKFDESNSIDNHVLNVRKVRDYLLTQLPTIKRVEKLEFAA